ncbi:TPA: hypothetical protein ACPVYZ_004244 [Vibrio parahaemolyticus]|uniref:hypothetical protein n=1 Tax=Vibrio parahaemolyticus TaxID=670 RepID=UPI001122D65B|nr:hypothetical protein [Vibrio parahaemolyticus]MBE4286399.1 hypothetical protein [Vibrio parahaemolyticus]TOH19155.1 hypothetical protein CGI90_04020 [Vibrio parahaemolyticus]HCG7330439.1 hypothetical protein [Vibrio parahaemolyticus]HCG9589018.1 hypothetical protein [Vibrio parahaemolyticus]HCM0798092.1 hypothetical protein [Vibrio parahaemolyticus]
MAMTYSGFSVDEMILFLQHNVLDIKLLMLDNDSKWRITVLSKGGGTFHQRGTLFNVVKAAFEPYLESAKAERAEMRAELDKLIPAFRSVPEPLFSYMCRRCEQIVSSVDADGECDRCNGKEKRSNW